jgi:F-type H+-transporting ATPase subunit delta
VYHADPFRVSSDGWGSHPAYRRTELGPAARGIAVASIASGSSALAQRYASALFELADGEKALDQVADDLKALRQALADSADLRQLVRSPLIGRDAQRDAMVAILEKAGAAELTRRFVGVVAANRRLFALAGMIDAYLDELAERRGEITAKVTTAHKLTDDQTKALTDQIKKAVGAKVSIDVTVDPALLGGLVVQVGSRMVDNSLRSKLNRMQLAMKGVA